MKTIKIGFSGFWPGFVPEDFCIYQILQKHYNIEISDDPDYIICSVFGDHNYVGTTKICIFFSGENYIPDFNLVDYGVSVYPLEFLDRHMSFPGLVEGLDYYYRLKDKKRQYSIDFINKKNCFANMIASHDSDNKVRTELFDMLSQYKRVEAPGKLRYNMPNGEKVNRQDGSKRELQQKCKFTLCCESTCEDGFITEKLFEAFEADTIPIYLGSSTVNKVFNKDAFINIAEYDTLQDVVKHIIKLDQNDDEFITMLQQPIFAHENYIQEKLEELEKFLCNIFDQKLEKAGRRPKIGQPKNFEKLVRIGSQACIQRKEKQNKRNDRRDFWRYLPNRTMRILLGKGLYERIKNK